MEQTHRFGGKVFVVGGIVLFISALFPIKPMIIVMMAVIAAIAIVPAIYSYAIYREHLKNGIVYEVPPKSKAEKTILRVSAVFVTVILLGVTVLMLGGNIEVSYQDTVFKITPTYWDSLEVDYSEIDSVEYRTDIDVGERVYGFGSARLSLGRFRNEDFRSYTLYAYTDAKGFVVLTSNEKTLVIGMSDENAVKEIYDTLREKTGK